MLVSVCYCPVGPFDSAPTHATLEEPRCHRRHHAGQVFLIYQRGLATPVVCWPGGVLFRGPVFLPATQQRCYRFKKKKQLHRKTHENALLCGMVFQWRAWCKGSYLFLFVKWARNIDVYRKNASWATLSRVSSRYYSGGYTDDPTAIRLRCCFPHP